MASGADPGLGGMSWQVFAFLTMVAWGLYGILLHSGVTAMADPVNGRYKAFLFVGVTYFLTAVVAPLVLLATNGASWDFPPKAVLWSLLAGAVGAIGAFGVLLAFGAGGSPSVVMAIIFAGAPIINAIVALSVHPPTGGWGAIKWQFYVGIVLAAMGGSLVTLYKPPPRMHPAPVDVNASVGGPATTGVPTDKTP